VLWCILSLLKTNSVVVHELESLWTVWRLIFRVEFSAATLVCYEFVGDSSKIIMECWNRNVFWPRM